MRLGENQLAISDAFGAVAFLPSLFLVAGVLSGQPVIATADRVPLFLAALGAFLMIIVLVGLVLRSRRTVLRMGVDTLTALLVYGIGVASLVLLL